MIVCYKGFCLIKGKAAMKQIIHSGANTGSAHRLQQQAGLEDHFDATSGKKYDFAKVTRNQLSNGTMASGIFKSIEGDLYGREVETLLRDMQSEVVSRNYQEELRTVSKQLLTIQENERQRIAADLHDGIGQSLSIIKLSLDSVMLQIKAGDGQQAVESLQQISRKVKEAMDELHRTAMDMRPSMLDDLGIIPTLSWFFREFESVWRGRKLEKDVSISESDVPASLRATIFRLLQEAMNNIVKHAGADCIRISLKRSGGVLQLSIEDDGCGFDIDSARGDPECPDSGSGFGLLTMKERVRSTNGVFEMKSVTEQGTRILVSWRFTDGAIKQGSDMAGVMNEKMTD